MNLRLLQLCDSALPVGGYTHSWGLESALARRIVHDAESLERWCRAWLRWSLAPFEGVLVAGACRAWRAGEHGQVLRAAQLLEAGLNAPTVRAASLQMGEQLLHLAATWPWSAAAAEVLRGARPHHAAVFGLLAGAAGASPAEALAGYLHQSTLGMISAGSRAVPVGHTHAQQALAYLQPDIEALAAALHDRPLESAGASSPFYEVLCDEQPRLYVRLFRS